MKLPTSIFRGLLLVDAEGSTAPTRRDSHRQDMRHGVYEAVKGAFYDVGIDWNSCALNDTGDGIVVLTPPDMPPIQLVEDLPYRLAARLRRHNETRIQEAKIRLRVAVNVGVIHTDTHGHNGQDLTLACRLLDAPELRDELRNSNGVLAIIMPDSFYRKVVVEDPGAIPDSYRHAVVDVKGGREKAWLRTR